MSVTFDKNINVSCHMAEYRHNTRSVRHSVFCPHTFPKTSVPLVNCIVNDGLVRAMQNMQKTLLQFTTFV